MTIKPRESGPSHGAPATAEAREGQPGEAPSSGVHRAAKRVGWTVTKQFEREGYRYRLMRRPVESSDAGPRFTTREEEALALASDGCSNKRIAQVLDVSPSTVGVLLFRAATKLNVKSREDLVAAYKQLIASSAAEDSEAG
ncbi:MAG TPA: helix-turn-helix transcriptional regulator [Polyangiaceae bacterium]|jgi:DNA-binding CsgD family transcriptional regulator|nr:helix-turn-helix transcriptional regulator [Polyangiaceae bacterium]